MTEVASASSVSLWSRSLRVFRRLGPYEFARLVAVNARLIFFGAYRDHAHAYDLTFDQQHEVETAGTISVEELDADDELKQYASRYEPAEPNFVNFLINR